MYGSMESTEFTAYEEPLVLDKETGSVIPKGLSIPRRQLTRIVSKRAERSANCHLVPFSLALYIFICSTIILHGRSELAYDMESTLNNLVVNAGDNGGYKSEVYDANSWVDYLAGYGASDSSATLTRDSGWINSVVSNRDNGVNIGPKGRRGRIRDNILIVGGIHLIQTRRAISQCLVPNLRTLFGTCHSGTSLASFGDDTQFITTDGKDISSAFRPSPVLTTSSVNSSFAFQYWLSSYDTRNFNQNILVQLDRAGWLDASTASVSLEFAVINGESGFVGRVALTSTFTSGGRVESSASISSVPLDPYGLFPELQVIDTFVVIYLVYLILNFLFNSALHFKGKHWDKLFGFWHAIDGATIITLLVAVGQYGLLTQKLLETNISINPAATASDYASGPNIVGNRILTATLLFESFKSTCVILLILVTTRLFYYFTFQPRLAIFTDAMSRAGHDIFHFGIVFSVVLTMFGVWGHFQFGALAPDWHSISSSIVTVFRFMQYDYDLVIMEEKNRTFADAFFVFALYGVTNLFLWALVGIILEAYSVVMNERAGCPTVFDEGKILIQWLWHSFRNPSTSIRWLTITANVPSPRSFGPTGASADSFLPPYSVILKALEAGGPMGEIEHITPEVFSASLGVSLIVSAYLIAEARSMRPGDIECGWAPPLPPNLASALEHLSCGSKSGSDQSGFSLDSPSNASRGSTNLERSKTEVFSHVAAETDRLRGGDVSSLTALINDLSEQLEALKNRLPSPPTIAPPPPSSRTSSSPVPASLSPSPSPRSGIGRDR